jgi:hypothetical protein
MTAEMNRLGLGFFSFYTNAGRGRYPQKKQKKNPTLHGFRKKNENPVGSVRVRAGWVWGLGRSLPNPSDQDSHCQMVSRYRMYITSNIGHPRLDLVGLLVKDDNIQWLGH